MDQHSTAFKPSLRLIDATMIVAGSMIGSGIFIVSTDIVRNVGSAGWLIVVWLISGLMTVMAAVSYGEMSGMFPKAGGQYVYLKEAFNPLSGFLYGWSSFTVIQTATIAAVGVAFSRFTAYLIPEVGENVFLFSIGNFHISEAQVLAIAMIVFLTYTNTRGINGGKIIQTSFTSVKLLSLFGLIILGFLLVKHSFWQENWQTGFHAVQLEKSAGQFIKHGNWFPISGTVLIGAVAAAMVGSLFSSDAWNNVTFIAGEIKNPKRNIGLSLFLGTMIVSIIYITTNLMYLNALSLDQIAFPGGDRVAVAASNAIFGNAGAVIIAVMIMVSTFGCNNGLILAGARVYYTMANDGLFFKKAGILNKKAVPEWALWAQATVASILCLSGGYNDLLDMIAFVVVIFYVLTIIGIFVLRKRKPNIDRPYKAFGYPFLPGLYILLGLVFCVFLIIFKPLYTLWGLGIVLAGIPVYYITVHNQKKQIRIE
ncbi:MAG: amino acid permease [Bacteroidota bacterium]|nr:amino acid permease [Bacteroidota bacterium]